MARRRRRSLTPPVKVPIGNPDEDEVVSVHSIPDSSVSPPEMTRRSSGRNRQTQHGNCASHKTQKEAKASTQFKGSKPSRVEPALTISDDSSSTIEGEDHLILEDVNLANQDAGNGANEAAQEDEGHDEEDLILEDVPVADDGETGSDAGADDPTAYAAAYEAANADAAASGEDGESRPVVYYDGKGQAAGFSISLNAPKIASSSTSSVKRKGPVVTPRDRQVRLATHKLVVLSVLAHARIRNEMINDDGLRDDLYGLVPNGFLEKLRMIHPKKVPIQNERVRQFEAFLRDLTRWWSNKFRLDPTMTTCGALRQPNGDMLSGKFPPVGRRVDGWIIESGREREERQRRKRAAQEDLRRRLRDHNDGQPPEGSRRAKGKSRVKIETPIADSAKAAVSSHPLGEITLFGIANSTQPVFLRLSERAEVVRSVQDLISSLREMTGSREMSAQLFAGLCRALGIPSRLVVSVQAPSWSVGASKVSTGTAPSSANSGGDLVKRKRAHMAEQQRQKRLRTVGGRQSSNVSLTSDEESFAGGSASDRSIEVSVRSLKRAGKASQSTSRSASVVSGSASPMSPSNRNSASTRAANSKEAGDKKGKGADGDGDYRDERWRNVDKPIEVEYVPKLRALKPKALKATEIADDDDDADPIDTQTPPTMWVEVFSKPWQKWVTVDPIRGLVEPLRDRHMEPSGTDKNNRLVYVVGFEEDGYARDVTARYTRTLHSRVNRMRPPPTKRAGEIVEWWPRVAAALHRPQRLDRDAIEDEELDQASSREPMPTSVAAFKDHPVYALEKHLKRDEVIFPAKQAGTFQGVPVFLRSSVIACKSARQWYNEGRVLKDGEEALKWVKSRGYTLANKRAEEEARQQGFDGLQEGLYALFQTQIYRPPPIVDGVIPKNSFGNIDLFVDTMLPPGAAHVPYNGTAKVAKQLGIDFAEAIVGFEFRKHRSMPKMKGIVVAEEHGDLVLETFWTTEHQNAERAEKRKREKELKERRKKVSAAKIRARMRRDYGHGSADDDEDSEADEDDYEEMSDFGDDDDDDEVEVEGGDEGEDFENDVQENVAEGEQSGRRRRQPGGMTVKDAPSAGGFMPEEEDDDDDEVTEVQPRQTSKPATRRSRRQQEKAAAQQDEQAASGGLLPDAGDGQNQIGEGDQEEEEDLSAYRRASSRRRKRKGRHGSDSDADEGGGGFVVD